MLIIFDLEKPLTAQWKKASIELNLERSRLVKSGKIKPIETRNHIAKFPNYLRAHDASAVGVKHEEIAEILFPEKSNEYGDLRGNNSVRDAIASANNLIESSCRHMGRSFQLDIPFKKKKK